ncbi:hypothetical protein DdX_07153 [Ditylenchus destructor]|uniref:F-box domain-containing protein n=1 Tax=Ditylenchus destructor TaxID=166010 RepID=A0AAD4R8Y5_9BILA|nr:hypothetical protein DdX_07153 [Ditylenchus destructor]
MYSAISTVLSISTFTAALTECFKKKATKATLVLEQAKPEQPMDQLPHHNIPFGLFYKILACFDRRELCRLRNVNRRHYIVIESKFGTTPYLVFKDQRLRECWWEWSLSENQSEEMPIQVRRQLPTSKFVRFNTSTFLITSVSDLIVQSISHVWENQELFIETTSFALQHSNYVWNEEWTRLAAKAKYLDLNSKGLIPYLRQLTSGNCVHLELCVPDETLDDVQIPWGHILDFLFKRNTKGMDIYARHPSNHHQVELREFFQQVKQKFLDSLAPVDFNFEWTCSPFASNDDFTFDDCSVENPRTKQHLILNSTAAEFQLTIAESEQ